MTREPLALAEPPRSMRSNAAFIYEIGKTT